MPSLFRFLIFLGLLVALGYGAVFSLATFVTYKPREIIVTIPPDKFIKITDARRPADAMTRRQRASDETVVELFLDMLAAERGAGEIQFLPIATISTICRRICARQVTQLPMPPPTTCADSS